MSSPAARAHEQRRKTRGDFYCERPDDVADNSPVPRYGYAAQQALILSEGIVIKAMWSLKPTELPSARDGQHRGAVLRAGSINMITKATSKFVSNVLGVESVRTEMPRRTVAHCLNRLERKGFIERWEAHARAKTSPVGESWRLRRFDEILGRWAADPAVGTVGVERGKRAFYVIGKGKRLCTPTELDSWKIQHSVAEANPAAHAGAADIDEPAIATPAAPPAIRRRITVQEELIEDTAVVHAAILACHVPAEPEQAAALLAMARQVEASIPATAVAMLIHEMASRYLAHEKKANYDPTGRYTIRWTVGWFTNDMPGAVHQWRFERDAAQRATGSAR